MENIIWGNYKHHVQMPVMTDIVDASFGKSILRDELVSITTVSGYPIVNEELTSISEIKKILY